MKLRITGLTVISILALIFLGYYVPRENDIQVQVLYLILFLGYFLLYRELESFPKWGIYISILFRLVLIFSLPALSDDFNRFIWDGRLLAAGINPFHQVPEYYMLDGISITGLSLELFNNLNYTIYHTMYPPVAQFTAWLAVVLGRDSVFWTVVVMRLLVITAEFGSIVLIRRLLVHYNLSASRVLLYALNPLVILELTGNLHHEVYVIFFILLAVYLCHKNKFIVSSGAFALAIASKLLPLIFLPVFLNRFKLKKVLGYYLLVSIFTLIVFTPFLDLKLFYALRDSGWLYFQKFEFNGSIYYLVREAGYLVKGYNIIESSGKWMAVMTTILIFGYLWIEKKRNVNIFESLMWILTIYLAFTTTLHPWYILPLVAFSVFTSYRYTLVWSYFIFLTYAGYTNTGYEEPLHLIAVEYMAVYGVMIFEIFRKFRPQLLFQ